ncbi:MULTISPECIES: acyl-CoA dehydrogenase [unclassified Undibacterium]|uniref:acyl-CoA dehydrogenase n=1 Tax=unclassified Undibacterium TaxID=2630295 RepID=UPI002AC8C9EF|nr:MULTISPECIES: acyl-CoA dehydrogenase [unclassified Undibacterium]MEB0139804.1 acyl-CoA dehydrogenase [Undibacterium sp. CCC2.1]MEB0170488.1 acyl-CoA dehydrogenase [Undibacterium sp. CCC1.1]MEB0174429.1 acyl-CoA dehydrogenase [Undibacterium sp. CCC3.4]MEB0213774.1 acyl-CoA dehydrogenase [Undibacterium sp. 5I2]WPX43937.1 acyl-CoA dehydrogenase [Undibacterium sp. CCC3.4]
MTYLAPVKDMLFVINELADLAVVNALPGCEDATAETVQAVLQENAKFAAEVVAPLNWTGDQAPSYWQDGKVVTSKGFKEAFQLFGQAGWQGVQHPQEFGGQGLPKLLATPCIEMLNAASISFALCPLLTDGAIEALLTAGSDEQKALYLENLISGKWTGTMNLTEPQAGSDLAMVRSRAVPQDDGTFKVFGTKIYITYGEHDMAENIVHLVLARTPDAPEGVKGISLFLVPKFLVNADGSLGARNDAHCVSIEHKLGIKASPTAVLQFGDHGGAIGSLIGQENRGLEYMFIMMNAARFGVGMQGIGIAERAYQKAVGYARDRVQSRDLAGSAAPVAIIRHPDVRRMLMSMRAQTEGARALAYVAAATSDLAHHHPDAAVRASNQAVYEFLVPVVKGWATEMSLDVTSTGVQVHGGMGFIEETGAAQHYRDARILTIYEGTTAIQANDLIGRKTARDGGATAKALIAQIRATAAQLTASGTPALVAIAVRLAAGATALEAVVEYVLANVKTDVKGVFAGSVVYLKLAGIVLGGWQMARAALIAQQKLQAGAGDAAFYEAKIVTARFFADHILSAAPGMQSAIVDGSSGVLGLADEQF